MSPLAGSGRLHHVPRLRHRPDGGLHTRGSMTVMAWFKKERKPKTAPRERREIPADAWEKCEACGHIDIREKFERALNVCPECGTHKRFSAEEYIELLS